MVSLFVETSVVGVDWTEGEVVDDTGPVKPEVGAPGGAVNIVAGLKEPVG